MVTSVDTSLGKIAQNLLNQYGKAATYKPIATATYSTSTGVATPAAATSFSVKTLVAPPSKDAYVPKSAQISQRNMVETQMRTLFVAGKTFRDNNVSANPGDVVTLDSVDWKVMIVEPFYSGEQIALYQLSVVL